MIHRLLKEGNILQPSLFFFVKSPFMVFFNVTQRCNLHCSYCFGQYYSDAQELALPQIQTILSEFYNLGARRLGLGGGEPLLYHRIEDLIEFSANLGFSVGLNSNGILVPKYISALKQLDNLSISLDGASCETHDKYRGKGSFHKAMEGIECAYKAGIPLHLCVTLTDANVEELPKIIELGERFKALVQISPLYRQVHQEKNDSFPIFLSKENFLHSIDEIIKEKKKGGNIFFSERTYQLIKKWPDHRWDTAKVRRKGHPVCLAGKKFVHLDSAGKLYPCARASYQMQGNSCLTIGVKKAYLTLPSAPCKSCMWACYLEYNSLLNLSWGSLWNFIKSRKGQSRKGRAFRPLFP